jgi:hypothetical protein
MRNMRHEPGMSRLAMVPALALLVSMPFSGCLGNGGTELPNEVRGTLYTSNGSPAVNAEVKLYRVDYVPEDSGLSKAAVLSAAEGLSAHTNAMGHYEMHGVPDGRYNVVASGQNLLSFRDSVLVTEDGTTLPSDTLREPGIVTGTVRLQVQHTPQTAIIQALGTAYYTYADADGRFSLSLPQGAHRLRVFVDLPGYVPLFHEVTVRAGKRDTVAEPLAPF